MGSTGGDEGSRTPDLLNAIQALSQLSYIPEPYRAALARHSISIATLPTLVK